MSLVILFYIFSSLLLFIYWWILLLNFFEHSWRCWRMERTENESDAEECDCKREWKWLILWVKIAPIGLSIHHVFQLPFCLCIFDHCSSNSRFMYGRSASVCWFYRSAICIVKVWGSNQLSTLVLLQFQTNSISAVFIHRPFGHTDINEEIIIIESRYSIGAQSMEMRKCFRCDLLFFIYLYANTKFNSKLAPFRNNLNQKLNAASNQKT